MDETKNCISHMHHKLQFCVRKTTFLVVFGVFHISFLEGPNFGANLIPSSFAISFGCEWCRHGACYIPHQASWVCCFVPCMVFA